jgi:glutamate--cysteine ligase
VHREILAIDDAGNTVLEDKTLLVEYLEVGCKPPWYFSLGAEQEQFVFQTGDYRPAVYEGPNPGIKTLLKCFLDFGWRPVNELGQPIALYRGVASITIEPGGQIELSGSPLTDAHQIFEETLAYSAELEKLGESLGLSFLSLGHQPKYSQNELPWMPKQRYSVMRSYMTGRGSLGQDESCYLEPPQEVTQIGRTLAEQLLLRYEHEWHQDIDVTVHAMCEETSL